MYKYRQPNHFGWTLLLPDLWTWSDVMIAGALFYTIQSNTDYSGALQSDAFWADSVSSRRNIVLPWGGTSILNFTFTFLPAFILTAEVVLVVSYVSLWTSVWFLCGELMEEDTKTPILRHELDAFFHPCCVFFQLYFQIHILLMAEMPYFANTQSWTCCNAANIFGIFALLRSILVETNLKYTAAFALFTLFEGDRVYSISTIWRFKLYLFSPPLCERL